MHESRSGCIVHHVNLALRKSALTGKQYGQAVADLYMERTPLHARGVQFHASADPYADERNNEQLVRRFLTGVNRMPVDLEEALVLALPEPFQTACLNDLSARFGLLAAPLPAHGHAHQAIHLGEFTRDAGETLIALAPMFADGRIDARDAKLAKHALEEIAKTQAMLVTMEATIRACAVPHAKEATPCDP